MKILIVDDDVDQLYLLESMLRGFGYQVVPVQNGMEAMQQLEQAEFDLIIADILMPQMDGFELCRQVKLHEAFRHIPFILYTATYTERKDEELGLRLGASRFIIKPAEPEVFHKIIQEVIQQYKAGHLPAAPPAPEKEEVLLKAYNRRLVRKLEEKLQQLDELNKQLTTALEEKDREVAQRRSAEEELRKLNVELEQRVHQRTAELTASNQSLQTFASAVSHDLRAPLRAIQVYSDLLAQTCAARLDSQSVGILEKLRSQVVHMERLIGALLQLARATRGELRREPVDLSQLVLEIVAELRQSQPGRAVEVNITRGLVAQGDPVLLRTVLQNLLANAWKFTAKAPQARIEFGAEQRERDPAYFVRDNGVGFDQNSAGKLFSPFQRLHHASDFPGTGIGLATVREIVRRHGGEVWANSAVGQGATFYFTLP